MKIQLFVAGDSPSSRRARRVIETLMADSGEAGPRFEVIDVLCEPARALASNLLATPTLILRDGDEISHYVGDLHDRDDLMAVLSANKRAAGG